MNKKGHAAFTRNEVMVFIGILYSIVFTGIFAASGVIAIILKKSFFKQHSVWKMALIISVIITLSLVAYSYISQWYWQHYGFYYSMRNNPYYSAPEFELKENGEIYRNGKPWIIKGKYYGWQGVYQE